MSMISPAAPAAPSGQGATPPGSPDGSNPAEAPSRASPEASKPSSTPAPKFDLDALLDGHLPEPGSVPDPKKVVESLSPEAQKLVANLRADYTRKMQALAKERQELESNRASWLAETESSLRSKMDLPADLDVFSAEGIQKYVQAKVAEAMLQTQAPIREQAIKEARTRELQEFKAAHPDLDKYKQRVVELASTKKIRVEDAYWIAKGEAAATREAEEQKRKFAENAAKAKVASQSTLGSARDLGDRKPAKFKNAWEAFQAIKK